MSQCPTVEGAFHCSPLRGAATERQNSLWRSTAVSTMKVILLVFLSLLTSAETRRKFISPEVVLPGDYLEEENEEDEKATNVEQSPAKLTSTTAAEEESSQEEQALESTFGPHYLTTLTQSPSEEPPLDVSDSADRLQKNAAHETSQGYLKVDSTFAVSCATLTSFLIFAIFCCVAFAKYRMEKRCSCEQQKRVPDSSVVRAAKSSLWSDKTPSDPQSNGKKARPEIMNSVIDMPRQSHSTSLSNSLSDED